MVKFIKKVSSNKNQTLPETAPSKAITSPPTASTDHQAPIPFIDKISIVVTPPTEEDALLIHSNIWAQFSDKQTFLGSSAKWGEFKVAKKIVLPSVPTLTKLPLLQYSYVMPLARKLRLEFVPVDLGPEGMIELDAILTSILNGGWAYVKKFGKITRLDVTVDFPGVMMADVHLLPQQGATSKQWAVDGSFESYTHGKSKGNQTAIYDRKKKRVAQGKQWVGKEGVRVERRLKTPTISSLNQLPTMANPFAAVSMVYIPTEPPDALKKKTYIWTLFQAAVEARGLPAALALLPEERRTAVRKHLAKHKQSWWAPDQIWSQWPKMLIDLGIAD